MLLDSCFLLCCLSLPMPSPFPIGGMSAKHLQKIVFKLPCHSTVMCLRISTVPSSLISKLLHLIAAVSPTHHPRLLCCILIPTAAAKKSYNVLLVFSINNVDGTADPRFHTFCTSSLQAYLQYKLLHSVYITTQKKKSAFSPIPFCLLPSSLHCWAGGNWRSH